ncbi:hypothetical protein ADM90_11640 [Lysinibacillus macroides]|uniref:Uncharacterized protein n=1 Tax=Lysinibacillus macroides TaxID=33935 RepID=A0A0M9DKI5_9BACI|nr:hypothetical protein ADM90_11640 [Lysinibacillus macroides]
MLENNDSNTQLPTEIESVLKELVILKHLRNAGTPKSFGFSNASIFQLIFCLIFEHKTCFVCWLVRSRQISLLKIHLLFFKQGNLMLL